jgi:hypothetical protein
MADEKPALDPIMDTAPVAVAPTPAAPAPASTPEPEAASTEPEPELSDEDKKAIAQERLQTEFLERRKRLEERKAAKVKEGADKPKLPPVQVVYIPGTGVPSHEPMFFDSPFGIWLTPNVPTKVEGTIAKGLACEFPKRIFLSDDEGNPRPFPASQLKKDKPTTGARKS